MKKAIFVFISGIIIGITFVIIFGSSSIERLWSAPIPPNLRSYIQYVGEPLLFILLCFFIVIPLVIITIYLLTFLDERKGTYKEQDGKLKPVESRFKRLKL
ncbi:hypothetical protein [Cytobacillus sp. IB215665]|uniref:hypothetical protein n=1 Tax=Cytobacillus sp. IB215665 TaxID=3097357 RepID=UPI002A0BC5A7|nr:hypothetical protein [Cytobacillus sp. IB215665]MDX8367176.1 hypothetical protein [Cytobacillus sp. IB215665]